MNNPSPIPWSIQDIIDALSLDKSFALESETHCRECFSRISTDSRTIGKDELFLALSGENFDGHDFITGLLKKGIKGFLTSRDYQNSLSREEKKHLFQRTSLSFFSKRYTKRTWRACKIPEAPLKGKGSCNNWIQRQDHHKKDDRQHIFQQI